jgi:hypothetical protein
VSFTKHYNYRVSLSIAPWKVVANGDDDDDDRQDDGNGKD